MAPAPDLVGILDIAYGTAGEDAAWLDALCAEVRSVLAAPLGCAGFLLDASNLDAVEVGRVEVSRLDVALDPCAFVPANGDEARPFYGGAAVAGTASGQVGGAEAWRSTRLYREHYRPSGVEDVLGVVALDAQRRGCVMAVLLDRITVLQPREVRRLTQLGAHLSAALRLRRRLRATTFAGKALEPEAVLDPSGKVLHAATKRAALPESRAALREMARRLDKSRTSMRRTDPDAALDTWTALVTGRWTLLDHFDHDGRRFLVAHKNAPALVAPHALDDDERTVAAYAALGRSGKTIAYELGVSPSKVSRLLQSAIGKLGLRNPAELASTLGTFVPPARG